MAQYSVIRIRGRDHVDEHTNVGIILFDGDGNYLGHKVTAAALQRAVDRGDLAGWLAEEITVEYVERVAQGFANVAELAKYHQGFGAAMSCVQIRSPLWALLRPSLIDELFEDFVEGRCPNQPRRHEPAVQETIADVANAAPSTGSTGVPEEREP